MSNLVKRLPAVDAGVNNGNAAAMREALEYVLQFDTSDDAAMIDGLTDAERIMELASHIDECQKRARAALAAPRNCDVGTEEEQKARYRHHCDTTHRYCIGCALEGAYFTRWECALAWAQMPYKKGGAE